MAGLSSLIRTASRFLRTEDGKRTGSTVLRRAADTANRATGSKHASKIERARSAAEKGLRRL